MGKHIQEDNLKTINGESIVGKDDIKLPTTDIEEWINSRPKVTKFGERPELLILDDGTAKMVEVSTEGIFTDIRSFSAFVGGAIEGGTNIFRATIRNVSGVSVNGLEVTVVLPESGDDITYEEPNVSNPTTGTVTEVSREGNIYNYDISSLPAGKTIEISFPITWGVPGTFQASTTVKVIDPVVVDYSTGDDYSTASYRVSAKTEGVETEDCPLIEVTSNGIQVPVYSVSDNNALGVRVQVVSENDIILKTNIPVTFIGHYPDSTSIGNNRISGLISNKHVRLYRMTYRSTPRIDNGTTLTYISPTELKVSFDPTKNITGGLVELRAGAKCNPQYVYVNCKYAEGEGIGIVGSLISEVDGIDSYNITAEYSKNPIKYSFIDLDTGIHHDSVNFYERDTILIETIILNIPSGVSRTIELVTSDKARLVGDLSGNITSSFDLATGKTTLEISDTASSQDNFTSERVTFNFLD